MKQLITLIALALFECEQRKELQKMQVHVPSNLQQ